MRRPNKIVIAKSTFCLIMLANGLAVSIICYWAVRPTFIKRDAELRVNETRMELIYLRGLLGVGPLVSTLVSLSFLEFARKTGGDQPSLSPIPGDKPREP